MLLNVNLGTSNSVAGTLASFGSVASAGPMFSLHPLHRAGLVVGPAYILWQQKRAADPDALRLGNWDGAQVALLSFMLCSLILKRNSLMGKV